MKDNPLYSPFDDGFMMELLNPYLDCKKFLIDHSTTITNRVKYTGSGIKKNAKQLDKSILNTIEDIVYRSIDITLDYNCTPLIGLSLADEYGENGRESFHKICKINKKYNADMCNSDYSKYLKNDSEIVSLELFYILYGFSLCEKLNTLITEKNEEIRLKEQIK